MSDEAQLRAILHEIAQLVRVPTSSTPYRSANQHWQADFDRIRQLTEPYKHAQPD